MINCFYDCYRILYKVYGENKSFLKQAFVSTDIDERFRSLTVKICYGVLDKDGELSYSLGYFAEKSPKLATKIIVKIGMYAIKYLNKKDYAVIDGAVELAKKMGKGGTAGFINAVLRKYARSFNDIEYPKAVDENISVRYSYPLFAVRELLKTYGKERTESLLKEREPVTTLVFYDGKGEEYLKDKGVEYEKTPFEGVFKVKNFVRNSDYDKGIYTFQSLGSVAICDAVEPSLSLLDCCAAPGGKSVRLSKKFESVCSWDIHPHRVELIEEYIRRMGIKNIRTECADAKVYKEELKEKFDAVLVDAPCSGLGVASENPDLKLNRTEGDLKSLISEQKAILDIVSDYVKKGGYLYYSTCSVLDSENTEQVKSFLSRHKEFKVERIESKLPHENKDGANAFLPDISEQAGFFVAKLKRVK